MTSTLERSDLENFRGVVARRLGLQFGDDKLEQLAGVLRQRIERSGEHVASYLGRLTRRSSWHEEGRVLAEQLTVGETYFFRNPDHFRAVAGRALPERMAARAQCRTLRILSAGCASGEEPYSLATVIRDGFPELQTWRLHIVGIDVNPAMLEKAARARYSEWSLRETPPDVRASHFRPEGRDLLLDERLRAMVTFEERNLIEDDALFWQRDSFDIVFCRNVIMYFSTDVARAVIARIAQALAPGGFLFLGHAETLRGISQDFQLQHTHETFYYQRRDGADLADDAPSTGLASYHLEPPSPPSGTSWMETIDRASERIARLARECGGDAEEAGAATDPAPEVLGTAMELVRKERFREALEFLCAQPATSTADPDRQLLQASLLFNGGALAEAERLCAELLASDELNAGAHYLTARCREHAGDRPAAVEHDQTAIYLDPAFAMPHLHRGLLARRAGDLELARRELGQFLLLLPDEDAVRLLLFGGGFGRDGLGALCRSELLACGRAP